MTNKISVCLFLIFRRNKLYKSVNPISQVDESLFKKSELFLKEILCFFPFISLIFVFCLKITDTIPDTGVCCISQSYLSKANSTFDNRSQTYNEIFSQAPSYASSHILVHKQKAKPPYDLLYHFFF